ncbi:MAG: hypothetical protein LBJ82_05050 [Deltaproteobacteria bacterium]|nr:hypothetical protein [Deltaproteobacteria bacterium]
MERSLCCALGKPNVSMMTKASASFFFALTPIPRLSCDSGIHSDGFHSPKTAYLGKPPGLQDRLQLPFFLLEFQKVEAS